MKFRNEIEEKIVKEEVERSGLSVEELFLKKRGVEVDLTDFRRSQLQKQRWWKDRWKYMKGIKKFHRSTAGKEFHRNLGRFLATRDQSGSLANYQGLRDEVGEAFQCDIKNIIDDNREFMISILSCMTHALIEKRYFPTSMDEEVDYNLFLLYLIDRGIDTIKKLIERKEHEIDWEFWKNVNKIE